MPSTAMPLVLPARVRQVNNRSLMPFENLFSKPLDKEQAFCYSLPISELMFWGVSAMRRISPLKSPRCPDCGGPLVHGEGCICCPLCGFTRC
jgi:hypothetical protein